MPHPRSLMRVSLQLIHKNSTPNSYCLDLVKLTVNSQYFTHRWPHFVSSNPHGIPVRTARYPDD